jgi:hypothetical protein
MSGLFQNAPLPVKDRIVDKAGFATNPWIDTLTAMLQAVDASPSRLEDPVTLEDQSASVGVTPVPLGALASGLYRVSVFARVTRAATTSSSLSVSIGFTDGGVSCALATTAVTGNTTATVSTATYLVSIDQGTPITYATTYASVGGTTMQYKLVVVIERIAA